MKELLSAIKRFVSTEVDGVVSVKDLPKLDDMFVIELANGKKFALSMIELRP